MGARRTRIARWFLLCLAALSLTGCFFVGPPPPIGDTGTDVRIRNSTSTRLILTEVGEDSGRDLVTRLGPGEERVTAWHFKTGAKVTLRAADEAGNVVYCHGFTYEELRAASSRVAITVGRLDC